MGFGDTAAAATAATKRNAALRGRRKFLNASKRSSTETRAGLKQPTSDTVRKRFSARIRESMYRDRTMLTTTFVLLTILVVSTLLWLFL